MIRLTTIYSVSATTFLIGLALARAEVLNLDLGVLVVIFACTILVRRRRFLLLVFMSSLLLLSGWVRGSTFVQRVKIYDQLIGKSVSFQATALDDAVYSQRGQLQFTAGSVELLSPFETKLIGEIDIEGRGEQTVYRGDRLTIDGRLFSKRGGQIAGTTFANLKVIHRSTSPIDKMRRQFAAGMQNSLPEPLASFGLGLLIGQRTTLDPKLEEELIAVGLIHIVAVSGYNLTIIIEVVRRLFRRRSRFQSLVLSLLLIVIFLLFTGNAPSIVRAAIVSSLSLIAWFRGRSIKPILLLLIVAALTAGVYPLYLWSNIGWYLSFTAFFGVLALGPLLKQKLFPLSWQEKLIPSVLAETISAQICTLPLILYIFGRLSNISLLANLLVVPLTPIAMLLSLLAGLSGWLHFMLAKPFTLTAQIVLDYMLTISGLLAKVPYSNIEVHINTPQMVGLYSVVVCLTVVLGLKQKARADIITEEKERVY